MSSKKYPHNEFNLGERLRQYRKSKGLSGLEFAESIGISQGSLSDIENNKSKPSADTIENIIRHTDINVSWLFTGTGEMYKSQEQEKELESSTKIDLEEKIRQLEARIALLERILSESRPNPGRRWYDPVISKKK